jgi:phospholipid/cholesterol/gamma-HCH transport system substrate-binding protein
MTAAKQMKVGLFFFIGLLILGVFTLFVGNIYVFQSGFEFDILFDQAAGLKRGDAVRVSGVEMGKVKDLRLDSQTGKVKVTVKLKEPIDVWLDYRAEIAEFSMVGGRYIAIMPGTPGTRKADLGKPLTGRVAPGGLEEFGRVVRDTEPQLRAALVGFRQLMDDLREGTGTASRFLKDPALYDDARMTLKDARGAIDDMRKLTDGVAQGKGTVGKLLTDEQVYNDIREMTASVKATIQKLEGGQGTVGKLLTDDNLYKELRSVSADLKQIAEMGKEITRDIKEGKGLAGKVLNDETVYADIQETVSKLKETAESLKNIAGKIERGEGTIGKAVNDEKLYNDAAKTFEAANKIFGKAAEWRTFAGVRGEYYADTEMSLGRFYIKLQPREDKYFLLGGAVMSLPRDSMLDFEKKLEDEENQVFIKPDVQIANKFFDNKLTARVGLLEGKFGAGVDYDFDMPVLDHPFKFTIEARDAYNSVKDEDLDENVGGAIVRAYLSTSIWGPFGAYAGASRLLDDPEFMGGVSLEYEDEDIRTFVGLLGLGK